MNPISQTRSSGWIVRAGFLLGLCGAVPLLAKGLVVHEWGTFTSVSGSDGRPLPGLEVEEAPLPPFVGSFDGFYPLTKGLNRPVSNVTIKMETPVLYFYSDQPRAVQVDVGFYGGIISQWYPDRSGGEQLPALTPGLKPVDFAREHEGSISWSIDVLSRDEGAKLDLHKEWESPQWPRARVPEASRVRGRKGETEGFLFYRGLGNFPLPLRVTCGEHGRIQLENTGSDNLPFVFVYQGSTAWWSGSLAPGGRQQVVTQERGSFGPSASPVLQESFPAALEAAGLTRDEAHAMLATWRESYFEKPGLRVFWIVPRAFTDRVLPLSISPQPDKIERVLVGRTEVLTKEFERELVHDFAADGGQRWQDDRYLLAYRALVAQLGGKVAVAPVALPGSR